MHKNTKTPRQIEFLEYIHKWCGNIFQSNLFPVSSVTYILFILKHKERNGFRLIYDVSCFWEISWNIIIIFTITVNNWLANALSFLNIKKEAVWIIPLPYVLLCINAHLRQSKWDQNDVLLFGCQSPTGTPLCGRCLISPASFQLNESNVQNWLLRKNRYKNQLRCIVNRSMEFFFFYIVW